MRFSRTLAILVRQYYLFRGSPARIIPVFAWIAIDIVLWGFLSTYLNTIAAAGSNLVPALLGAVLLWDFFTRVMQGVTMTFFEDVWSRNFLNIFASPMSIAEYLAGLVLSSILTSTAGLVFMIVLATTCLRPSFLLVRAYDRSVYRSVVFIRNRPWNFRQQHGDATRALGGVVDLANSRADFPVRGCFLSAIYTARLDAWSVVGPASSVCLRRAPLDREGRHGFCCNAGWRRGSCACVHRRGVLDISTALIGMPFARDCWRGIALKA